ncbi:MAG: RecX family transcriptional regulator, partial [Calditrichaeota bacterium]|nr:RecX family transcriptional regulator [Calditrichota bacterium]
QTLKELQERKYLNDNEFIEMFIRDRIRERKSGPLLIKKKLIEKGAPQSLTDNRLQELFPENLQIEIIQTLVSKKLPDLSELSNLQDKQKLIRFILGRGFSWSLIERALKMSTEY